MWLAATSLQTNPAFQIPSQDQYSTPARIEKTKTIYTGNCYSAISTIYCKTPVRMEEA
jgi:hypothetical protein